MKMWKKIVSKLKSEWWFSILLWLGEWAASFRSSLNQYELMERWEKIQAEERESGSLS